MKMKQSRPPGRLAVLIFILLSAAGGLLLSTDINFEPQTAAANSLPAPVEDLFTYLPAIFRNKFTGTDSDFVIIGWNDLGMHCYDQDYATFAVLPPYNTLWAQVIRRGDPPELVTEGIVVEYGFPDNTRSDNKTNFWDYVEPLFGVSLSPNVGLAGKGMSGDMDPEEGYFIAEGIPITEFSDSQPTTPDYFQLAHLVVKDATTAEVLAETQVVAPVSSEMRCDVCHDEPFPNDFRMNILLKHDDEENTNLAQQALDGTPVLCASCHADPALGLVGDPDLPTLSAAMHGEHREAFPGDPDQQDCYACHPGPETECLRGVMADEYQMTCVDCHEGGMRALGDEDRTPWVDEPRCEDCHESQYAEEPGTLFRLSVGHGGMYCESCHNSTHAILPSREALDNLQSISLQGHAGTIEACIVCHVTPPATGGPHQ